MLVDGAVLPHADQLPPELQPLLRRQAPEITNKRWRYDIEQLIDFLKRTLGIPSKKVEAGRTEVRKSWFARNKSLILLASGFSLAIVIIIILVKLFPGDETSVSANEQTNSSYQTTDTTADANTEQLNGVIEDTKSAKENVLVALTLPERGLRLTREKNLLSF